MLHPYPLLKSCSRVTSQHSCYDIVGTPTCQELFLIFLKNFPWARLLGDINAAKKGKIGKRIGRRAVGKAAGRSMRKLFR